MALITRQTRIGLMLLDYPQTVAVIERYGLQCTTCGGAMNETVGRGAEAHGLDLERFLAELNAAVGQS